MRPRSTWRQLSICLLSSVILAACGSSSPSGPVLGVQTDVAPDTGAAGADGTESPDGTGPSDAAADPDAITPADVAGDDAPLPPDATGDAAEPTDAVDPTDVAAPVDTIEPTDAAGTDVAGPDDAGTDASAPDSTGDGSDTADTSTPPNPGAAAACDTDEDCVGAGAGKKCHVGTRTCVACLASKDCNAGELCQGLVCKPSKACKSDTDCKATSQVCDKTESVCVDCASDADCGGDKCVDHACVKATPCKSSKDCPLVCDQIAGVCVQCTGASDCKDTEFCSSGACKPKLCTGPVCAGGKSFACKTDGGGFEAGKSCNDNNVCTEGDSCDAGACKPGPGKNCNDGNPCTTDSCDPTLGCLAMFNTAGCDDGDKCTELDTCSGGKCAGKAKPCDDAELCTSDSCKDGTCVNAPQPGACTDGTACTDGDLCDGGKCKPGKVLNCDDGNPCTTDSCDPVKACQHVDKLGTCDDGNNCTQGDACAGGKCIGIGKQCDDGNPCTDDKCDGGVCSFVSSTKPCDDGNVCTEADTCSQGKCLGKAKACSDGNPCTDDKCGASGCVFTANTAGCDDGDKCTDTDTCSQGKCAGKPKACDDGNPCTDDSCIAGSCLIVYNTAPCGDPGSCAVCSQGKCSGVASAGFEEFFGGSNTDKFYDAVPVAGGGWTLLGVTTSKGNGGEDGWVVRVDAKGAVQWEKTFGSSSNDLIRGGIALDGGAVLTVGYRYYSSGGHNIWVQKLEPNGNQAWSKDFGGSYVDEGLAVAQNDKGFLVAGKMGKYCGSSCTTQVGWLLQLDFDGNKLWDKEITGTSYLSGVAPSADGNVYVLAQGIGQNSSYDFLVQKLKPGGSQVWSAQIGAASNDTPAGMHLGTDGSIYVSGRSFVGTTSEKPTLAKVDGNGTVVWAKSYGDAYGDFFGVTEVAGVLVGVGQRYTSSQYDAYMVGVNKADGNLLWERKFAGSTYYEDQLRKAIPTPAGGFAVVGWAYQSNVSIEGWLLSLNNDGKLSCGCDATCTDENSCTTDLCYLGLCKSTKLQTNSNCTIDGGPGYCDSAGVCKSKCGNGYCDSGENSTNCSFDCKPATHPCNSYCGKQAPSGCWCDSACKSKGDCCTASGGYYSACYGSTCSSCN